MSGLIPAPSSVTTATGRRLVISGAPNVGDVLLADSAVVAHWGPPAPSGPPSKTPVQIGSNIIAWFKADAIPLADGAQVVTWPDSSGGSNHVANISGTPILRATGGPKGLPCVDHSPGADFRRSGGSGLSPTGDFTYFAVLKQTINEAGSILNGPYNGADNMAAFYIAANSFPSILRSGVSYTSYAASAIPVNAWSLILVTFQAVGTITNWDVNGNLSQSAVGGTAVYGAGALTVGYYNGGAQFHGMLAEAGQFNSKLSAADLASLKAYLYGKYFA